MAVSSFHSIYLSSDQPIIFGKKQAGTLTVNSTGNIEVVQNANNQKAIISGSLDENGVKTGGSGFTSTYSSSGGPSYTIFFTTAFASAPAIFVTPINSTANISTNTHSYSPYIVSRNSNSVVIRFAHTYTTAAWPANAQIAADAQIPFTFIAVQQ